MDPFDKLGKVDYKDRDANYIELTNEAIEWYRELKTTDQELSHDPPNALELYPNMCNTNDGRYHKVKQQVAEKHADITLVWKCGPEQRENAIANDVYRWDDPRCTAELMGVRGEKTKEKVDRLLNFNRSDKIVSHDYIDIPELKTKKIYVDFETLNENLLSSVGYKQEEYIFMIGIGYYDDNKKWIYKNFTTKNISLFEEKRIVNEFINNISSNIPLVHWSNAEPTIFEKACRRHNLKYKLNWFDLLKYVENNNIFIKGALKFNLKTYATKFYEHNLIETTWDKSISNGGDAMFEAYKKYINNDTNFDDIIKYNEVDVKVMAEIVLYLTKKH